MRHRIPSLLLACASLLAVVPARAEVYTIKLTNGTTFESRYQPKQAAWDPTMVAFLDETGNEIALPRTLVADVTAQSETKGFGKVLNTTTVDLGFAPNDIDQNARRMAESYNADAFQQAMAHAYDQEQFVEPSEVGGGIPVGFGGGSGYSGGGAGGYPTGFTGGTPGVPSSPSPLAPSPSNGPPAQQTTTPPSAQQ